VYWTQAQCNPFSGAAGRVKGLDQRLTGMEPAQVVKELLA
jgi:hypothetical protein